ncbi:MAG TPA: hypothetical protein DCR80_05555 [Faecalibacterium sp.]|jgi:ABC-type oligopeptide transport system substrate-binding subunit|nr:hypothetical protein [Faecalibacterium sp.]
MKKMKRLVAVLLAGIMALAMLTACGGTTGTPVTRDDALEKSVAEWAVEWGKSAKLELTADADLTAISAKCLPAAVKAHDAITAMDKEAYVAAQKELLAELESAANGKKIAPVDIRIPNTMEVNKKNLVNVVNSSAANLNQILKNFGVTKPAKFGVTVTKQKDYTLILFMVSE